MQKNRQNKQTIGAECFVPGHITGFFEICKNKIPEKTGSRGCGIVLDKGISVKISLVPTEINRLNNSKKSNYSKKSNNSKLCVFLNEKQIENPIIPTLIDVVIDSFSSSEKNEIHNFLENYSITIDQKSDFLPSAGFGISAAGSLGVSNALIEILKNNVFKYENLENEKIKNEKIKNQIFKKEKWADLAHISEIKTGSGLGDVSAIVKGGLAFRKKPGAPSFGKVERIKTVDKKIYYVSIDEIETSSVLNDPEKYKKIKKAGKEAIKSFEKEKTFENFMITSNIFAKEIDLMSFKIKDALEKIEPEFALASQAMLGNTIFAVTNKKDETAEKHIYKVLSTLGDVKTCNLLNENTKIKSVYRENTI
ncbi:MAG: hypothetical protein GX362_03140 [Methanosarcinaceae archaeon]|nr:hypothetical protein [Methanosarcinaceae archaeon]